ncbi:MAG: dienelactone hydrolase family protein [Desulfuromonadales bacterium]|nr:dienelactone hydrolase family protein [Desulfuromonadales bacterium]
MRVVLSVLLVCMFTASAMAAGEVVNYQVDEQPYEGYYVSPAPGAPLVILLHDWDGLTAYEIQRAKMLAVKGYAVFAADLFGKGVRPTEVVDKRQHTGELYKDRAKMRRLIQGAVDTARARGARVENAVVTGYCFGGAAVLEFARSGAPMKGYVTFHGGLATPEGQDYSQAQGAYLILHGTADANITMEDFTNLAIALEQAGLPHEMITYGGAPHAFTVFDSDRYREDADSKSWRSFLMFLEETLR